MDSYKFVIIGGGVAGLACANRLADRGFKSVVIEKSHYPKQAVCGECLSKEALKILAEWDIAPSQHLSLLKFFAKGERIANFPVEMGTMPRDVLELRLLDRALSKGVTVLTDTAIESIEKGAVLIGGGKKIPYDRLLISIGKRQKGTSALIGRKAHIEGLFDSSLEIHLLEKGYLGIANIGDHRANVAMLIDKTTLLPPYLLERIGSPVWKEVPVYGFKKGKEEIDDAFYFGDGNLPIPPISGQGLTLALISAKFAADCAIENNKPLFSSHLFSQTRIPRLVARFAHTLAFHHKPFVLFFKAFPSLVEVLYQGSSLKGIDL